MRWRDRYLFCMEAVNRAMAATGEIKGHYLNVTAGTMEEMYERADFAKELGSVIVMIDLTIGYTAIQSMAKWARRNGVILHLHRAGHGTYTRQKTHGVNFRVIAEVDAAGRSGPHSRRDGGGQAGGRSQCDSRLLQHAASRTIDADPSQGLYFEQDWASLPAVMPVASGGIHAGQMHQLLHLSRRGRSAAVRRRHDRPSRRHRARRDREPRGDGGHRSRPATKGATSSTKVQRF